MTKESKHTPGPCEACGDRGWLLVELQGAICIHDGQVMVERCDACERFPDDLEAGDVAWGLLAAAPDLLAALKNALDALDVILDDNDVDFVPHREDARAAIAKATGGT
jgi:hypothetical protein